MKKTVIIICGMMCFMCVGCTSKLTIKENLELNEINGVVMTIKKDTLTKTNATIIIHDTNEEYTYVYGEYYRIDKKENGKWKEVKKVHNNYGFNDMAYFVDENGKLEFECNWEYMYGKLPKGEYRIVKYTFPNLERPITEEDKLYFSALFAIE